MLSIGLCDDQQESRTSLRWQLESVLEQRGIERTLLEFSSGETLLRWVEQHPNRLDLLFLDIEMGTLNGMEAARQLHASHPLLQLVFVTGFSDYVFDGYGVGALGYLMKPAKSSQLEELLDRTLAQLCRQTELAYTCRDAGGWYRIPHREILYFASDRRKITCVTQTHCYSFYGKLDDVAQELAGAGFVRIHQRYLVRAGAIRQICGSEVQVGSQTLPISRSCHQSALLALTRSVLEG